MKVYKHIFFDLDHTLWDFETNSKLALQKIFSDESVGERGIGFEEFYKTYLPINDRHWAAYHNQRIDKQKVRFGRFYETLSQFGIRDAELTERIAQAYIEISPRMTNLFPDALEVLQYLQEKYSLHLITNGFAEVQWIKIEHSGLKPLFEHIIISEEVGTQKPQKEIFDIAMERASTHAADCIMIGDNFNTDILGAKNAGMDQVYFNPKRARKKESVTHEIFSLNELREIL